MDQESEIHELPCFLVPKCMAPSTTRRKKGKNVFLRLVHAMKLNSLFSCTDKKRHCSNTELVVVTIFGTEQGNLHLVIQAEPQSPPLVVLELASSTDFFRNEIGNGSLQFFLSCVKKHTSMSIWEEWKWTEHVNGEAIGSASRLISEAMDLDFLEAIQHVKCRTGVLSDYEANGGNEELLYFHAEFEKTRLSLDAELLTMVRPDNKGWADISIRFSRV